MKIPHSQTEAPQRVTLDYVSRRPLKTQANRKTRILQLIVQIHRGDGIKATELKSVLGSSAWTAFRLQTQTGPLRMPPTLTGELRPYLEALRRADAKTSRGSNRQRQPNRTQQFKLGYAAKRGTEAEYEHALELLEHIAEDYPGLTAWFDRPVMFGQTGDLTPDAEGVPRLLGSRSQYAIQTVCSKELKTVAMACLYDALKTCGPSKSTRQATPFSAKAPDWVGTEIDKDIGAAGPFDLDNDLFRGLL
jgi:hypothetical protein